MSVASIHDYLVCKVIKSFLYLFPRLISSETKRTVIIKDFFLVMAFDLMKYHYAYELLCCLYRVKLRIVCGFLMSV